MAIGVNNSLENRSPNADFYYACQPNSSIPWPSVEAAHNGIPEAFRAIGKNFMIGTTTDWEWYTYKDGIGLNNLKPYRSADTIVFDFLLSENGEAEVFSKFHKLLLTEDVNLRIRNPKPGMSGTILVEQDEVGNHTVTFDEEGNDGNITLDYTAGVITEVYWRVDESKVIWDSKVVTPIIPINPPSTILDLRAEIIGSNNVLIKWTAPEGNEGDSASKADRYIIYVTESHITEEITEKQLKGFKPYVQNLVPKFPGEEEEFAITKLSAGRKYYIVVLSDKTLKGKTRTSLKSNIIEFYTAFNSVDKTEVSSIIQLDPERVFVYFMGLGYTDSSEDHTHLSPVNLTDLTGIVDNAGTPMGVPSTLGVETSQWGDPYNKGWYNFDYPEAIFDLKGVWNLDKIYIYLKYKEDSQSTGRDYKIKGSLNGTDWNVLVEDYANFTDPLDTWILLELDHDYTDNVRYISFGNSSNSYIDGFVVYGTRLEPEIITGLKLKAPTNNRTIAQRTGINCFYAEENPEMISEVSKITRTYNEAQWFMGDGFRDPGQAVNAPTEDDQKFNMATSFMWNYDDKLQTWKDTGQENLICISSSPPFLRTTEESDTHQLSAELFIPLDPGVTLGSLSASLNPSNYKYYARLCYNIAARYGKTVLEDTSYVQLQDGEELKTGLDLVQFVEPGNEVERTWKGMLGFSNAEQLAVRFSVAYDGHKGLLPGGGFKTADNNIKVLTSGYVQSLKGQTFKIMKWCDKNRGLGDYPFDILNYHWYSRWELDPGSAMWSSQPMHGICPERKSTIEAFRDSHEFRGTYMPNKEVWITEMGYDEQRGGTNSPPHPSQEIRSMLKGAWLMRSLLLAYHHGVDVVTLYWWANTTVRLEDLNPESNIRDTFLTCGITDGVLAYNDWNRKWLKSGLYLKNFIEINGDFRLKHNIVYAGVKNTLSTVIESADPSLYAFAIENDSLDKGIILWMIDTVNTFKTVKIRVGSSESSINVIHYHDLYSTDTYTQTEYLVNYDSINDYYYIELEVGELPVTVFTSNVGIGKLYPPENIRTQALSKSAIKLAWKDSNIGNNKTVIYRSLDPIENFTIIHNAYIDNGEFTDSGLTENTPYYYRIQFVDGDRSSDISSVYGNSTLYEMPVPENFAAGIVTTSSIQLTWELSNEDQNLIDAFNLYRSESLGGPYTKIQTLQPHIRSFTDLGLIPATPYYYKLNTSYKDLLFSNFTLVLEQTTAEPSDDSPVVSASKINYTGDKLYLRMDKEVKDAAGSENAFTIIKNGDTLINVQEAIINASDKGLVILQLESKITISDTVLISYDKDLGYIQSLEGFPLDSFEDLEPDNHAGDPNLFVQRIGFNILNAYYTDERDNFSQTNWNNSFQNFDIPWEVQMQGELINTEGELTGYRFLIPFRNYGDRLDRWADSPQNPVAYVGDDSSIADIFPTNTRKSGVVVWNNEQRGWKISNLNPNSVYNIYVHLTNNEESSFQATIKTIDNAHSYQWEAGKNLLTYGVLSDIRPGSYSFGSIGSNAFEFNPITQDYALTESTVIEGPNSIAIYMIAENQDYPRYITAILVEELNKLDI